MRKTTQRPRTKSVRAVLTVLFVVVSLVFATLSASALTITPEMLQSVQDFLNNRDVTEVNNQTLNEFVENFITTEQEKGNPDFEQSKIDDLKGALQEHAEIIKGDTDLADREYDRWSRTHHRNRFCSQECCNRVTQDRYRKRKREKEGL